jgi:hypothetical protein
MSLDKYLKRGILWITLLTGVLGISLTVSTTFGASPAAKSETNFVSLAGPASAVVEENSHSTVFSSEKQMTWLEMNDYAFLLLDKKNKHNDDEGEGNWDSNQYYDHDGKRTGSVSVQVVFGERDRRIIREYCSRPNANLPPGLAKRGGHLPPGLEKQLRRNGTLPPGLQKKVERFPVELERSLPPMPRNYARVFVGGRGLIVDAQFNILDVVEIFR